MAPIASKGAALGGLSKILLLNAINKLLHKHVGSVVSG
jgi:hypothetical protein